MACGFVMFLSCVVWVLITVQEYNAMLHGDLHVVQAISLPPFIHLERGL